MIVSCILPHVFVYDQFCHNYKLQKIAFQILDHLYPTLDTWVCFMVVSGTLGMFGCVVVGFSDLDSAC